MTALRNTRVLVLWAKPTATNLGIRALGEGVKTLCREAWGDCEFVLHDHDTPGTPLGRRPIQNDIGRSRGQIKQYVRQFDVVVDTCSGDSFTDIYGLRRLTVMSYVHRAVAKAGVPLVLAPQTIGPFETTLGRVMGRRSLQIANKVYSRDNQSTKYAEGLGRKVDEQGADVVFALSGTDLSSARSGLLLNVSGLLWRDNPHVDAGFYRRLLADTTARAINAGMNVTLFSHVLRSSSSREDDTSAVEQAYDTFGKAAGADFYIPESLEDVRARMTSAEVVVGARMHACLNALSVGTPAVAWAYSRKFAPLMEDLGWGALVDLRAAAWSDSSAFETIIRARDLTAEANAIRATALSSLKAIADDLGTLIA